MNPWEYPEEREMREQMEYTAYLNYQAEQSAQASEGLSADLRAWPQSGIDATQLSPWPTIGAMLNAAADELDRLRSVERNMHTAMQAARGKEKEECARMVREHARAISKGTFRKPRTAEEWGEVLAKHIEIPF